MAASNFQNRRGGTPLNGLNPEPLPLGMELPLFVTMALILGIYKYSLTSK